MDLHGGEDDASVLKRDIDIFRFADLLHNSFGECKLVLGRDFSEHMLLLSGRKQGFLVLRLSCFLELSRFTRGVNRR